MQFNFIYLFIGNETKCKPEETSPNGFTPGCTSRLFIIYAKNMAFKL